MTHHTDEELDALVNLTEEFVTATWHLLDNSETSGPKDDPTITVWQPNFDEVSTLLDRCEGLPSGSMEHMAAGELLAANLNSAITSLRAQLAAANARADRAEAERAFTLSDGQRMLRKQDIRTVCDTPDLCFEHDDSVARCGPCAAKLAERAGVALNQYTVSNPEAMRLRRNLNRAEAALAASQPADPVTNAGCRQQVKVKPLVFEEARNSMWTAQHGYQIGHNGGPYYRVKLGDWSILKKIKGFDAAVKWANNHNTKRILSALEPAHRVSETPKSEHGRADVLTAIEPAPVTPADAAKVPDTDAGRFDRADWFWRTLDPDDSADTPLEAVYKGMVGHFCVCEIASSYTGPTRYGFTAPVLDQDSDDDEFLHFATQQEAIDAAKDRIRALRAIREGEA